MAEERSFVFVRPPHSQKPGAGVVYYLDGLLARDGSFRRSQRLEILNPPQSLFRKHYAHMKNSPYLDFNIMIAEHSMGGIIPVVYTGESIARRIYEATGPTDCSQGLHWQVRPHFSNDVLAIAKEQHRCIQNVIHRSGLKPGKNIGDFDAFEGEKEIELWEPFLAENGIYIP